MNAEDLILLIPNCLPMYLCSLKWLKREFQQL